MSANRGTYLITGYIPQLSLTGVAIGCFGLLSMIFTYRFLKSRNHKWMLCLLIGTICMTLGFIIRIPMTNDPYSLTIYIVTTLFTLLSPCAFLAHIYLLLPRLATYLSADDCLFLKPRLIARTFVWIDVTVFLVQAAGGGMTAMKDVKIADAGTKIALAGLTLQVISFGTFCLLALVFAYKLRKRYPQKWTPPAIAMSSKGIPEALSWKNNWKVVYYAMLYSCFFAMIRCTFRVAEFAQGYAGKLRTVEWYIYALDTLPIFLAIAIWAIIWPPNYLGDGKIGLYAENEVEDIDMRSAPRLDIEGGEGRYDVDVDSK